MTRHSITAPRTYRVTTLRADHTVDAYDVPGLSPTEMVRAALRYVGVTADGTYEQWEADMAEANRFATFCIGETVDETGEWCDPRRSFRDLWALFLTTGTAS